MRTLRLLRHAKSDWSDASLPDFARPLSARGERAAALVRDHLRGVEEPPELVCCSDAVRTRMTLDTVAEAFPPGTRIRYDSRLYGASAAMILDVVAETPGEVASLLVVGHNPGTQEAATTIVGAGDPATIARVHVKYPTCALATFTFDAAWSDLAPGAARLAAFVTPADLV